MAAESVQTEDGGGLGGEAELEVFAVGEREDARIVVCDEAGGSAKEFEFEGGVFGEDGEGIAVHGVAEGDADAALEVSAGDALEVSGASVDVVNEESCIGCVECLEECPMGAITEIVDD